MSAPYGANHWEDRLNLVSGYFSRSQKYSFLDVSFIGKDFYKESLDNIEKTVHPDDKEYARSLFNKEAMIKNLEGKRSFS